MGLPLTFSSISASYAVRLWFTSLLETAYTVVCLSCLHSERLLHKLRYDTLANHYSFFPTVAHSTVQATVCADGTAPQNIHFKT